MKALVVDDESGIRLALGYFLRRRGYTVFEAGTVAEAEETARRELPDIVFLDQYLPDRNGEEILPLLISPQIGAAVIVMTAFAELNKAISLMKAGAEYFFPKPLDLDQVAVLLERLEKRIRMEEEVLLLRENSGDGEAMIGESAGMIKVQRLISLLAKNPETPVLILGESGTGKEMAARAIHRGSGFAGPLVEINCASLSENLLESELFGHEQGAFTDAKKAKPGLFEIARSGSIFLDELAEMPLSVQAKLLRVLDSHTFRRVGGVTDIRTDVRFIAATNKNLQGLVQRGAFRGDLYYRLSVLPLTLPPLRERGGDVRLLANFFVHRLSARMGKVSGRISPEAMALLHTYSWPGNVREMKNALERALILAQGEAILPDHLPPEFSPALQQASVGSGPSSLKLVEEDHIRRVLAYTSNNYSRSASILGISRSTLHEKLKRMGGVRNQDM